MRTIAADEYRRGFDLRQSPSQTCRLHSFETLGTALSHTRQKHRRIPREKICIPGKCGAELGVAITSDAEVGSVDGRDRHAPSLLQRAIHRGVVLNRMRLYGCEQLRSGCRHTPKNGLELALVIPLRENHLTPAFTHGPCLCRMADEPRDGRGHA